MIEENNYDIEKAVNELEARGFSFSDETVYLYPEIINSEQDILNEYTPDISKLLKSEDINVVVVKNKAASYLATRDASIILPLIIGIPFSILANVISSWIMSNFNSNDSIKLKFVKKNNEGNYKKIEIEGSPQEVKEIISELKNH